MSPEWPATMVSVKVVARLLSQTPLAVRRQAATTIEWNGERCAEACT